MSVRVNTTHRYKVLVHTAVHYNEKVWTYRWPLVKCSFLKHGTGLAHSTTGLEEDSYCIGTFDVDKLKDAVPLLFVFFDWFGRGISALHNPPKLTDLVIYGPGYVASTYKCATSRESLGFRLRVMLDKDNVQRNSPPYKLPVNINLAYVGSSINMCVELVPDEPSSPSEIALASIRARRKLLERSRKRQARIIAEQFAEIGRLTAKLEEMQTAHGDAGDDAEKP